MHGRFAMTAHVIIFAFMLCGVRIMKMISNSMIMSWHNSARTLSSRYCSMYSVVMSLDRFFLSKALMEGM